ncbi:MAG TPA: sigma-70 family RNA polymerase sigma factor [Chloroflexia bacterium]|nr:sigma-70 family RNA polymerase sigma factor [Chloroflexia bacterium]
MPETMPPVNTVPSGGYGLSRGYQRRAAVEAEIVALPAVTDPALLPALEGATALETLVHGIRRFRAAGRQAEAQVVAEWLIERAAPLVARIARGQAVRAEDREDLAQTALLQMWQEVQNSLPQHEFWEVHFAHMLRLACADAAERLRRPGEHERPFKRGTSDDGDPWNEEDTLADPRALEPAMLVPEALAQLDGNVRHALYLKTLGYKERSKDSSEPTISSLLGVSDRTVRNYLRAAEETLRPWLERWLLESGQVSA